MLQEPQGTHWGVRLRVLEVKNLKPKTLESLGSKSKQCPNRCSHVKLRISIGTQVYPAVSARLPNIHDSEFRFQCPEDFNLGGFWIEVGRPVTLNPRH